MTTNATHALEVRNLHKTYYLGEKAIPVLTALDVVVETGEMVVVMGPSGSGKTTLLNCVSGIDTPDAGEVKVNGELIDFTSNRQRTLMRRHDIGIVFQFFNLIPTLTVRENVGLPFIIAQQRGVDVDSRIDAMLDTVGLSRHRDQYPFQLSGGEMQLVSIARALVYGPSLLLADEPTGNVNPNVGRSIMDILRATAKRENTGILMVTHNPEHAACADRICFLKEGAIRAEHQQGGDADNVQPIHEKLLELGI
jgi:putative ABC transport system ATP-binding protein